MVTIGDSTRPGRRVERKENRRGSRLDPETRQDPGSANRAVIAAVQPGQFNARTSGWGRSRRSEVPRHTFETPDARQYASKDQQSIRRRGRPVPPAIRGKALAAACRKGRHLRLASTIPKAEWHEPDGNGNTLGLPDESRRTSRVTSDDKVKPQVRECSPLLDHRLICSNTKSV